MRSILALQRAATCSRYNPWAWLELCRAIVECGDLRYARDMFLRWQDIDPGNPLISFYRSMLLGEAVPDKVPTDCIRHEFDQFAASFDTVLSQLQYRVPAVLAELLASHVLLGAGYRTADLGCGTGLSGLVARPYSAYLAGVDLSEEMLSHAKARGIYDALFQADIADFLRSDPIGFDLIIAGDSLVYTGDLLPVLRAARGSMRGGALLFFSLEREDTGRPYVLGATGRFAHHEASVRDMLNVSKFEVVQVKPEILRMEAGRPVDGMLIVARATHPDDRSLEQVRHATE
jgi:predicted TPR repeat methyltransferase